MTNAVIKIESLSKVINKDSVLKNINAQVNQSDVVALLGENGSGKSTLIETILGFNIPSNGKVQIFDEDSARQLSDKNKKRIGYVPQHDELLEFMTVEGYLNSISAFYDHWNHELINSLITNWKVPKNKVINQISVGQKQIVSILSAIGHEPDLLVLDEPVSSLDPNSRRNFLQTLVELQLKKPMSILFSTHIASDVERLANRLWILKSGELVLDNSLDDIKNTSEQSLENIFIKVYQ